MENPEIEVIFENGNILAVNKPPHMVVFSEKKEENSLIEFLIKRCPELKNIGNSPRYGIVHRLDKETSGVLLTAKNEETLNFLQKQFKTRRVIKKYVALVVGNVRENENKIESLIGRSPKDRIKQKVYLPFSPEAKGKRTAITRYKVTKRFSDYTLLEVIPKTGRKHQIRVHLSYIGHPIAGDKKYGFKNQICPIGLNRHFLHAGFLKIKLPNNKEKEFEANLTKDLEEILKKIN